MEINQNNYEAYLLDFWEGTLSEEGKLLLSDFLRAHPHLDDTDALNLLDDVAMTQPKLNFNPQAIQYETINLENYEYFFIAFGENDLSNQEIKNVERFVKEHPSLGLKFSHFNKAKLPIETVSFPHKKELILKSAPVFSAQAKRWLIGVAASAVLFLWISLPFENVPSRYTMVNNDTLLIDSIISVNSLPKQNATPYENILKNNNEPIGNIKENTVQKNNKAPLNSAETSFEVPKFDLPRQITKVSKVKATDLSNVIASIDSEKIKNKPVVLISNNSRKTIETVPTLRELSTTFLQEKSIITQDKKPDVKGIFNSLLSLIRKEKSQVLISEKENHNKSTKFQIGALKIEHIQSN